MATVQHTCFFSQNLHKVLWIVNIDKNNYNILWFFFYVIFSQNVHHNLLLQKMLISFEDFPNFY